MSFFMHFYEKDFETVIGFLRAMQPDIPNITVKALNHNWDEVERDLRELEENLNVIRVLTARMKWLIAQTVEYSGPTADRST